MTEAIRELLRNALVENYSELMRRLAQRLGSQDLAVEALHEIWLRLERPGSFSEVLNARAYLYRAALNAARNVKIAETRRLSPLEIDALLDFPDEAPDAEQIVDSRIELARLDAAIAKLPERTRLVLLEALLGNYSYDDLAQRHGVTVRTIHNDLRSAIAHCGNQLGKNAVFAFGRHGLSRN